MLKVIAVLTGTTPLMMHNPAQMRIAGGGRRQIPAPEEEAAAGRYLMPSDLPSDPKGRDGKILCLYADHVHQCIKNAASGYRIQGKESVGPYISGSMEIQPEFISLNTADYEIDIRSAVVQKSRVMRARPKLWPWSATCEIHYDETCFTPRFMTTTFPEILKRAGTAIGLLEYRPQKRGKFGRFTVELLG
jgi:hypothetical protein